MTMITQEAFEAHLKCPRKSHLISEGSAGAQSRFHEWQRGLEKDYKEAASAHIRSPRQAWGLFFCPRYLFKRLPL